MTVNRYEPDDKVFEHPQGRYVEFSDYSALEAELELERIAGRAYDNLRTHCDKLESEVARYREALSRI